MWQFLVNHCRASLPLVCRSYQNLVNNNGLSMLCRRSQGGVETSLSHSPILQQMRSITVNQLHRRGPFRKERKYNPKKTHPMDHRPQMKGVVIRTLIRKPKKPNSANRKCAKVRLSNGKEVIAFIPGEGHNLQEHNIVLVEGGRTQDLIGVKHKIIRGKYDCSHIVKKKK